MEIVKRVVIVALAFVAGFAQSAVAQERCDPKKPYCAGLARVYKFEEGSDYMRADSLSSAPVLRECDGGNVGQSTSGKSGNALKATATDQLGLHAPFGGGTLTAGTVVFWVYPTQNATTALLTTRDSTNKKGVLVDLFWDASVLKVRFQAYENVTQTLKTATVTSSTSLSAWHMIAVKVEPFSPSGSAQICVSRDGAAWGSNCTSISRGVRGSSLDLVILGGDQSNYDGALGETCSPGSSKAGAEIRLDEALFYGRALTDDDISGLYNGGTGRFFPTF